MTENQMLICDEIKNKIFKIRGVQVMFDRDLATFYGVKPFRLREQIKRNMKKFPEDFMFELNDLEIDLMVSQNAIPSKSYLGGGKVLAFTEQGVANLASILTSDKAIEINLQIIRAFVSMRRVLSSNSIIFNRLDALEKKQISFEISTDEKLEKIFNLLENKDSLPEKGIIFDGEVFDAYIFISDLIGSAKKEIILIDNYIDYKTLKLFLKKEKEVKVKIYTKEITSILKESVNKFNKQYGNLEIKEFDKSHDRFLILDRKKVYHIGASLKDLGKKWFGFSKFEDVSIILQRLD